MVVWSLRERRRGEEGRAGQGRRGEGRGGEICSKPKRLKLTSGHVGLKFH